MYDLILDATNAIPFVMVDASGVEVAGLGGTFTVTVRKNGGSFGASAGAKAELAGGWYLYTATAGECNTAGPLALKITGAGCVQQNLVYRVQSAISSDVWTYATRTLTSTAAATMAAVDGSTLAITARATYSATISGLTISATWEKIWFTLKSDISDADASSVVQILETNPGAVTDGLLYLNGAAGTAVQGSLTINQAGGTVAIVIADEATDDLAPAEGLMYDIKQLVAGVTTVLTSGIANITYTATAAVA
jgi:hypothetical protein